MKNYLFAILILFILPSCMEPVEQKPSYILSEDSMVRIMIDIHLLEAATAQKSLPRDSSILVYLLYEKDLFKKYGINDSIYKKNLDYYSSHPTYMLAVYEKVVDSLSWQEEKGGKQNNPNQNNIQKDTTVIKSPVKTRIVSKEIRDKQRKALEEFKKKKLKEKKN